MVGRDQLPGELGPYLDLRDSNRYHSRLVRGQIETIEVDNGIAAVVTGEILGRRNITVPVLWLSGTGRTSAWGRYMPMGGELVNVAYRNNDEAHITGYDATASNQRNTAGWSVLKGFEEDGDIPGFSTFKKLKRGEFDFKSSGDAYIFGSSTGTLLLAGGQAFIRLSKQSYRIESKSSDIRHTAEVCETRFGTVHRKLLPTDVVESAISSGIYKEFLVDLVDALPTGTKVTQSKIKFHLGDILDSSNIPQQSEAGQALRARISAGDSANLNEVFSLEIDQTGNVFWDQINTASDGLILRSGKIKFNATGASDGTGGLVNITPKNISLGANSASNKAVLWDPGLIDELNRLQEDINILANELKTHRHAAGAYQLGIPTGVKLQVEETKFLGSIEAGFTLITPPELTGADLQYGTGPADIGAKPEDLNMNTVDSTIPRELGGIFSGGSNPGDASSNIVSIES